MRYLNYILFLATFVGITSQVAYSQTTVTPAVGVNKVCSARLSAGLFAKALATKIKVQFDAQAAANKQSTASVRVSFSPARTAPQQVKIDFAKDVTVSFNPTSATNKVSLTGTPSSSTLYGTCDPGKMTFTIFISYRDLSATPAKPVNVRETIDISIPGQYL